MISIHAAREGGDLENVRSAERNEISIHAAREGGDMATDTDNDTDNDFNPRRP